MGGSSVDSDKVLDQLGAAEGGLAAGDQVDARETTSFTISEIMQSSSVGGEDNLNDDSKNDSKRKRRFLLRVFRRPRFEFVRRWRRNRRLKRQARLDTEEAGFESEGVSDSSQLEMSTEGAGTDIGRDYESAAVVLREDEYCLIPGETMVRVEDAPGNARRIFCAIDIFTPVDSVWSLLTDYERLHHLIPSLVSNEVLERRDDGPTTSVTLRQVGAAELLPGLSFKAKCTLDVVEYPNGIPAHMLSVQDDDLKADTDQAIASTKDTPLVRGVFPRPYAISNLPHKDLSMQSVEVVGRRGIPFSSLFKDDSSDFSLYQGVWRIQPLPGCTSSSSDDASDDTTLDKVAASRLSYAVELRPALPVPVALLEGRIASDLVANLRAIRVQAEENYELIKAADTKQCA